MEEGKTLALAVGMTGAVVIALGTLTLYASGPPPTPARPKPPPPPETLMNSELRYSATLYRALVEEDAKAMEVPAPRAEELARPFRYSEEWKGRRKLRPRAPFETRHLRLGLEVAKRTATVMGQTYSTDHLVLRIENLTGKYLAYRIETSVADRDKCTSKGDIPHNAIALEPGQTITRTECLYRPDEAIELLHVEVMELPALAAHYVSRLPLTGALYDPRTASGHLPMKGALCPQTFSWREIKDGVEKNELGWRDVVDFYARHNCAEYTFFRGYRYRTDPAAPLPARPLD